MSQKKLKIGPPQTGLQRRIPYGRILYVVFAVVVMMALFTLSADAAATSSAASTPDMWSKAKDIMTSVYNQIVTISTIAAVVTAAVALLLMNFSKNGKTVDESRSWLKRIIISWAIINGLGFIMAYLVPFFSDGKWNG